MKQLFINIGFITILFAFTLNINYCKKNDTIEPEPENPIKITGTVSNNITEQSNNGNPENTLDAEINDTIHVIAKGTADHENSDGFDTFRALVFLKGNKIDGIKCNGELDGDGNIDYTVNMEGDKLFASENAFASKKIDVMIEYHIRGDSEYKYHKIGEINIKAEKDYLNIADSYNISKNKKEELATILSDNTVVSQIDNHINYDQVLKVLNNLFDGKEDNDEVINVSIKDQTGGNNVDYNAGSIIFHGVSGYNQTLFTNSETTVNDLLKLYGLK